MSSIELERLTFRIKNYLNNEEQNAEACGLSLSEVYDTDEPEGLANSLLSEALVMLENK